MPQLSSLLKDVTSSCRSYCAEFSKQGANALIILAPFGIMLSEDHYCKTHLMFFTKLHF